jgi:hypothetical protein
MRTPPCPVSTPRPPRPRLAAKHRHNSPHMPPPAARPQVSMHTPPCLAAWAARWGTADPGSGGATVSMLKLMAFTPGAPTPVRTLYVPVLP